MAPLRVLLVHVLRQNTAQTLTAWAQTLRPIEGMPRLTTLGECVEPP